MIILPDRNVPRSRLLMPVHRCEWMPPSRAQQKTFCGDESRTRFRLRARTHDGHLVWTGWFEDRDDADAFLFALAKGNLGYERALWRLPTPEWNPGISPDLAYEFSTVTFLTATTSSTYTKPADWNNSNNTIECVGGGGSGGVGNRASTVKALGCGGGGGGYGIYTNLTLSGNATYQCGTGGVAVTRTTAGSTNGNNGLDTWFGVSATSYANASVGATGGTGGGASSSTASGGTGGSGKGTSSFSGGRGGNASANSNVRVATGAGGAAGLNGNGNQGVDQLNRETSSQSDGGSGDAGFGGSAGTAGGGNGGNGSEWSASYGSGGGGGGLQSTSNGSSAGSGGDYGGGGGGAAGGSTSVATNITSGAGRQGLIVVEYGPSFSLSNTNLPMIGM